MLSYRWFELASSWSEASPLLCEIGSDYRLVALQQAALQLSLVLQQSLPHFLQQALLVPQQDF
jgi:hypothetical protein